MNWQKVVQWISVALFGIISVGHAQAQTGLVPKEQLKMSEKKALGWSKKANIGFNASFSSSSNVVGQTDGNSQTYGLNFAGGYTFADERSEWQNSLSLKEAATRTPTQPRFVKSSDELRFESLFLRDFASLPDVGPYAKFHAHAPIFPGEDVRATPVNYTLKRRDGTTTQLSNLSSLRLSGGFKPLTTRESAGGFWKAMDNKSARLDVRLGVGAEQVAADGQWAVEGANPDGSISVKELKSLSQMGIEAAITGKGQIDERTSWSAGVETLTPFVWNKEAGERRDGFRLTTVDGFAKLTTNMTSWASLSYDYKALIQPLIVDRVQQTHMFVLNINHEIF